MLQTVLTVGELRVDGMKVTDDGKLTVHWKQGKIHRQTVLESGSLYDALRSSGKSAGKALGPIDTGLLDAFFAEHAK